MVSPEEAPHLQPARLAGQPCHRRRQQPDPATVSGVEVCGVLVDRAVPGLHAANRNYAGALIIWDRLFGTYQAEVETVRYGVTTGFVGHNPLVIQLAPLWKLLRGDWKREKELAAGRAEGNRST